MTDQEVQIERPFDAGDAKQVNERNKKLGRKRKEKEYYIRTIMGTPQGRAWMLELLESCKIFGNPVVPGDPYFTYHNIGEQNVGKKLLQDINVAAPQEYVTMMQESRGS